MCSNVQRPFILRNEHEQLLWININGLFRKVSSEMNFELTEGGSKGVGLSLLQKIVKTMQNLVEHVTCKSFYSNCAIIEVIPEMKKKILYH